MNAFKLSALAALTATMGFLGGMGNAMADQQLVDQLSQLKLNVKMLDNRAGENGVDCAALGADWASCNRVLFTLSNDGQAIDGKDWVIYFHSPRQTLRVDNDQFKIAHLTGDLYKLEPTAKFSGFPAGKAVEIPVVAEYWQLFRNDFLPRWYATSGDAKPKMLANTDTENLDQFVAPFTGDKAEFIEKVRRALYLGKIVSYAQGFSQLKAASKENNWDLHYGEIAKIFRAGCIIRAQFLQKITDAYAADADIANLLLAPYFKQIADEYQQALRDVVAYAVQNGIPTPTFSAAIAYYDSYRSAVLPANLIQAQRDYFGAHTYKRIDKEGVFHTEWME